MLTDEESEILFQQYVNYINSITEVTEYDTVKIETYLGMFYFANKEINEKLKEFNKLSGL